MPQADAELQAKIVPDESAIEEVENRELELGGDGELSSSQENTRQGIISGGFRTALVATGIVGLLTSLKPLTATVSAILGIIGRSLIPILEGIADFIRPINEFVNNAISQTQVSEQQQQELRTAGFAQDLGAGGGLGSSLGLATTLQTVFGNEFADNVQNDNTGVIEALAETIQNLSDGGAGSPDQSDEANKIDAGERFRATLQDKTGALQ